MVDVTAGRDFPSTCAACGSDVQAMHRFCPRCGRGRGEPAAAPGAQPPIVTDEPIALGDPAGRPGDMMIGDDAERRLVSVIFADISGFTAMSEVLDPEDVHEIINTCFEELAAVVHRYGGTVDKFLGDGVMALFGAPHAHEDDAERAVAAALEMRQALNSVSDRLAARLPQPLALHVGANTGLVVAGRVGSLARNDYTVLGDTVNLAARLEDASEGGQILVAETTHKMTRHAFSYRTLPPVTLKGKRDPAPVYELTGVRARRTNQRGLPGIETPFVGREGQLNTLLRALDALGDGRGGLITIGGPAGVGKSRLLRELRKVAEERSLRWVQAGTSSLSQGGALTVWSDALRRLLMPSGGAGDQTTVLRPPTTTGLENGASLADVLAPTLPPAEREQLRRLGESALRGRLFVAACDLLAEAAARQPLVVVLEDLHWADAASSELLQFVAEGTVRTPLLLLATFRSDATTLSDLLIAGGEAAAVQSHIELVPLTDAECRTLATAVLGTEDQLAPVRDLLVQQAEGNPFYLEEVLRALTDQGALEYTPSGIWRLTTEQVEAVLPPSLQGLLLDRIDRLPEQSKRLLQIAAVAGRQFPLELVAALAGEGVDAAGAADDLIRGGFLERSQSTGNLRFRHTLMQEAAYSSLLLRHRRAYHRRVAETLEAQPRLWAAPAELPAVLTYHWEHAEIWQRAAVWALRAADGARRAFAPLDAARLYARALAAASRAEPEGEGTSTADGPMLARSALAGLADAALATGEADAALDALDRALALEPAGYERAALERRRGQALARLGMQGSALEAYGLAAHYLGDPEAGGEETPEIRAERATLRTQIAFTQLSRGDVDQARRTAEEVVQLDIAGGDRADALRLLGVIDLHAGDAGAAVARFEAALAIAREIGDLLRVATLSEQIGHALPRRHQGAETHLTAALEQFRRLGDHAGCARCLEDLGVRAAGAGDFATGERLLRDAIAEADAGGEAALAGRSGLHLGRLFGRRGEWSTARAAFERAGADDADLAGEAELELALLEIARGGAPEVTVHALLAAAERAGARDAAAHARLGLATLARRRQRPAEARGHLRAVLEASSDPDEEVAVMARIALAQVAASEGNAAAAIAVVASVLDAAEQRGPALAAWYARRVLGSALDAAGRHAEAEVELGRVVDLTRAAGARPELAASLSAWARARRSLGDPTGAADALAELRLLVSEMQAGEAPTPDPPSPSLRAAARERGA